MSEAKRPSGRLSFPEQLAVKISQSPCGFVVTGGGGWIGQATLEMLESALGDALPDRVSVFGSSNRDLVLRSGRTLSCRELKHISAIKKAPTFFVHCAFLTKDRLADQSVESFIAANKDISDTVAMALEASDARGLFVPSSGAVYKKGTRALDDDLQKNAYGVMKVADEKRFVDLAARKNMPLCMPRLFNLAGPFINKLEIYALASMIGAVLRGEPISIRASHNVVRSYIHVADLVTLAFSMLLEPQADDQAVFDTSGAESLEMQELAERVREALQRPDLAIQRPDRVDGRDDIYVGDGRVMKNMMQARGMVLTPMVQQIRDTASFIQNYAAGH